MSLRSQLLVTTSTSKQRRDIAVELLKRLFETGCRLGVREVSPPAVSRTMGCISQLLEWNGEITEQSPTLDSVQIIDVRESRSTFELLPPTPHGEPHTIQYLILPQLISVICNPLFSDYSCCCQSRPVKSSVHLIV